MRTESTRGARANDLSELRSGEPPRRHYRLPWVVAVSVVVLAAAAAGVLIQSTKAGPDFAGPLSPPRGAGSTVSGVTPLALGDAASIGIFIPPNRGSSSAVLESARLIGVIPGTRLLGIRVTSCGLGADSGFPPLHVCTRVPLSPLAGYVARPGATRANRVDIVVGISAPRPGIYGFVGVSLDYRVGTQQFQAIYAQGGEICANADCSDRLLTRAEAQLAQFLADQQYDKALAVRVG